MSIADKLITIANNTPAVCYAVNESRTNVQVSNGALRVDDVYEDGHYLKCQASAGSTVTIYGKNMIETASVDAEADKNKVLFEGSLTGDFVFSCLFNYTECKTPAAAQFEFTVDGATVYQARGSTDKVSKKLSGTLTRIRFLNWGYGVGTVEQLQLEVGTKSTDYEVFKDYEHGEPGTNGLIGGFASKSPTMTIVVDSGHAQVGYFASDNETYVKYKQLVQEQTALRNYIEEE